MSASLVFSDALQLVDARWPTLVDIEITGCDPERLGEEGIEVWAAGTGDPVALAPEEYTKLEQVQFAWIGLEDETRLAYAAAKRLGGIGGSRCFLTVYGICRDGPEPDAPLVFQRPLWSRLVPYDEARRPSRHSLAEKFAGWVHDPCTTGRCERGPRYALQVLFEGERPRVHP